jgi:hypothetical protein
VDPSEAYTTEVQNALMDAMLEYGGPLGIAPDEWLTVAARDNEDRRLSPADPFEVVTITLRIRGEHLAAFAAGRIGKEEAKKRVEIREF